MKKISSVRYALDAVITIMLIILMQYSVTGNLSHEIIGIAEFVLFIIHVILNRKWFRGSLGRVTSKKTAFRIKFWTVLDYFLIITMTVLAATSAMISHLFILPLDIDVAAAAQWHKTAAYASLIIISVHLGLHWKTIITQIYRKLDVDKDSIFVKVIVRAAVLVVSLFGLLNLLSGFLSDKDSREESEVREVPQSKGLKTDMLSFNRADDSRVQVYRLRDSGERVFTESIGDDETLEDFLSKLVCTGCSRHCPLISPGCRTGAGQQGQAQSYYNSYIQSKAQPQETQETEPSEEETVTEPADTDITDTQPSSESKTTEPSVSQTQDSIQPYHDNDENNDKDNDNYSENDHMDDNDDLPDTHETQTHGPETYDSDSDKDNWFDLTAGFGSIMVLFVAGTYFTIELAGKIKKNKK